MHIGLFAPVWPPGETANGIVTYVQGFRDGLRLRGHRVTIFSGSCETSLSEGIVHVQAGFVRETWQAVRRRFDSAFNPILEFGSVIADTVLARHKVDPLDVFEMEESFGWCRDVASRLPIPTVVKLHGPAFLSLVDGGVETPERLQRIQREGRALRDARAVIAPSQSTRVLTAARYALSLDRLSTVPNPVAGVADSLVWRAEKITAGEILYVGRFDYRKGGGTVLHVFGRLASLRPDIRLNFVGPDTGLRLPSGQIQHFADYVRENFPPDIAGRIHYLGTQPSRRIAELRLSAAVTVTATRWESFGYVIAEAMNQGCPIVGFDVEGVNELVVHERTGLLAPLDDIDTMARFLSRVLDEREFAASLGARARKSIRSFCGEEVVTDRMVDFYSKLVGTKRVAGAGA